MIQKYKLISEVDNIEKGTVTIIFQAIGASTKLLSEKNEGDYVKDFVGPLGQKSEIYKTDETVICVGGGIGIAPIYPIVRSMKEIGNKVISIIGACSCPNGIRL